MTIREATESDLSALMTFYIRMNEVINTRTNKYDPENAVFPSRAMVAQAIAAHCQFVGIEDNKIAAACLVTEQTDPAYMTIRWQVIARPDEVWVLHALRVLPEYEGRGFAKALIAFLITLAAERGKKAIRLDVLEGYGVDRLYRHFDFQEMDTVEIFYEDIGHPERFRLFERSICSEVNP